VDSDLIVTENSAVVAAEPAPAPLPEIVQRYIAGEDVKTLAQEYGVCRQTIYNYMFSELGDDKAYEQAITRALIRRIADADDKLENAATSFDVARAREMARFARMDLERRRPKLYGQQAGAAPVQVLVNVKR